MLNQHKISYIVQQINYGICELSKISNRLIDPRRLGLKDDSEDAKAIYEDVERVGKQILDGASPFLSWAGEDISNFAYHFHTFMRKGCCDEPIASMLHSEINKDTLGWGRALQACEKGLKGFHGAGAAIVWFRSCNLKEISDSAALRMIVLVRTFCVESFHEVTHFANQYDKDVTDSGLDRQAIQGS